VLKELVEDFFHRENKFANRFSKNYLCVLKAKNHGVIHR
jgi:hypothetical protein